MTLTSAAGTDVVSLPIVTEPMYLNATLNHNGGETELQIYISPIVECTDALFAPVLELLDQNCSTLRVHETYADDMMMFGEGIEYGYLLFEGCPGDSTLHNCALTDNITVMREGVIV